MFRSAKWLTQTNPSAGYEPNGEAIVAEWTMRLPVADEIKPLTTITAAHHQGSMQFPGGTYTASVHTTENTCSS